MQGQKRPGQKDKSIVGSQREGQPREVGLVPYAEWLGVDWTAGMLDHHQLSSTASNFWDNVETRYGTWHRRVIVGACHIE